MSDVYLKKEDLIIGESYECDARNFSVGEWNGKVFIYIRTKFGSSFESQENHWDDGPPYGTVKPLKLAD
jgi:hypothetical protein